MINLVKVARRIRRRGDDGATAVEYGLLVALIAVVLAAGAFFLGQVLRDSFNNTANCVASSSDACVGGGEAPPPAGP